MDKPRRTNGTDARAAQKRAIAGLYDRVASIYDAVGPEVFSRFGEQVVATADIGAGARVLDAAAGRGANLFPAAASVGATGHVVGIDLAEAMVAETARTIQRRGLTNAHMLQMDAEQLTFDDAFFDYVLCSFAYFFFPHLDQALAEFHRVLRVGGTLLLTAHGGTDERWRWYEDLLVATYETHDVAFPPAIGGGHVDLDDLEMLLARAGCTGIQRVPCEVEAIYVDEAEWWAAKWTHGARRPLESMPPEMLRSFVAEVDTRLGSLREADGFHERWRIVCMLGRK